MTENKITESREVESAGTSEKATAKKTRRSSSATRTASVESKPLIPKDVNPEQYVTVRNGFQGKLVYRSRRTGELFVWDGFGTEQEIELRELKNAKNSSKKFFENNWFMFDEDWIVDYLGVRTFYKNAVKIEDFDSIFEKDADSIKEIVSAMSKGQKRSVAYRAKVLIAEGKIDSNRAIAALEESLGVELVER